MPRRETEVGGTLDYSNLELVLTERLRTARAAVIAEIVEALRTHPRHAQRDFDAALYIERELGA